MNILETEQMVESIVLNIIKDTQLELVDVEYAKERNWYLRVFITKPTGLDLDDCRFVSRALENELDRIDSIKETYFLEVSSPGLERVLKKDKDYQRHNGEMVEIHTFAPIDGKKTFIGKLTGHTDKSITILSEDKDIVFILDKVSQVKLHYNLIGG